MGISRAQGHAGRSRGREAPASGQNWDDNGIDTYNLDCDVFPSGQESDGEQQQVDPIELWESAVTNRLLEDHDSELEFDLEEGQIQDQHPNLVPASSSGSAAPGAAVRGPVIGLEAASEAHMVVETPDDAAASATAARVVGARVFSTPEVLSTLAPPHCSLGLDLNVRRFTSRFRTWPFAEQSRHSNVSFNEGAKRSWQQALVTIHVNIWKKFQWASERRPDLFVLDGGQEPGKISDEVLNQLAPRFVDLPPVKVYGRKASTGPM